MVAVTGPQVIHGDLSNGFSVGLAHKDLKIACELRQEASVPLPVGNLVKEIHQMCVNEMGFDTKVDSTAGNGSDGRHTSRSESPVRVKAGPPWLFQRMRLS